LWELGMFWASLGPGDNLGPRLPEDRVPYSGKIGTKKKSGL